MKIKNGTLVLGEVQEGTMHNISKDITRIVVRGGYGDYKDRVFERWKGNKDGSIGGFVENTASVWKDAHVGIKALVIERAQVLNSDSRIEDCAIVKGDSRVISSRICDNAVIGGNAEVWRSEVSDHAFISGKAKITDSKAHGHAVVNGTAEINFGAEIGGDAELGGNAALRSDDIRLMSGALDINYSFWSMRAVNIWFEAYRKFEREVNKDPLDNSRRD